MSKVQFPHFTLYFSGTREEARTATIWLFDNCDEFEMKGFEVDTDQQHPEFNGCFTVVFRDLQQAASFRLMFGH